RQRLQVAGELAGSTGGLPWPAGPAGGSIGRYGPAGLGRGEYRGHRSGNLGQPPPGPAEQGQTGRSATDGGGRGADQRDRQQAGDELQQYSDGADDDGDGDRRGAGPATSAIEVACECDAHADQP